MTPQGMKHIREYFPSSKWANETSAKYQEAFTALGNCTDEEVLEACKSLRQSVARLHMKPEEFVGEVRRNRKRVAAVVVQRRDFVDEEQVLRDRKQMMNTLLLAPQQSIRSAVAYLRRLGALGPQPLSREIESWSAFTVGMVFAAVEQEFVNEHAQAKG